MIKPPETFELELNGVIMQVQELDIPKYSAFRVIFSSKRKPLVVARTKDIEKEIFWTSIPEGRQKEAEGVGKLIDEYFKTKVKN
jgi:hypothetical protein